MPLRRWLPWAKRKSRLTGVRTPSRTRLSSDGLTNLGVKSVLRMLRFLLLLGGSRAVASLLRRLGLLLVVGGDGAALGAARKGHCTRAVS
jgi:hypothetical protein